MKFDEFMTGVKALTQNKDVPIGLKQGIWSVKDRKNAWKNVATMLFDDDLNKVGEMSVEVLSEINPMFELEKDKRFAANIYGKKLKYSTNLRKGQAETLALLGAFGDLLTNCSTHKARETTVHAIRNILQNADWKLWGSLGDLLPTMAESAPEEFLRNVANALRANPCPFDILFSQEGDGIAGQNYMYGLLWALEALAWDEKYVSEVAVVLAELENHDPGGTWANRPINSLKTIFLPWLPQTEASFEKQVVAIKAVKKNYPDTAWKVLLNLLPNQNQISTGTYKPRWRQDIPGDWKPEITKGEYFKQVSKYAELAVELATADPNKLSELAGNLDNLPEPSLEAVLGHISSDQFSQLSEEQKLPVWNQLKEFIVKHRKFKNAEWALPEEIVCKIEAAAENIKPDNPLGLYQRLFSSNESDLFEEKGSYEEQREKVALARRDAVSKILETKDYEGLIEFLYQVESPFHVGLALGELVTDKYDIKVLPICLVEDNNVLKYFSDGYIKGRFRTKRWEWVDKLGRNKWKVLQKSSFLVSLPFEKNTWDRVAEWLGKAENEYWKNVFVNPYQTKDDLSVAIDKLIEYGRPRSAIECLDCQVQNKLPIDQARSIAALMAAVESNEPMVSMDTYHIKELIKSLQKAPDIDLDAMYRIEWKYLSLLDRHENAAPKYLQRRLANEPEFFDEVMQLIYKPKNRKGDKKVKRQIDAEIASHAWKLLHEWKRPPGLNDDDSFDPEKYRLWIQKAIKLCTESDRIDIAMIHIGQVLFYSPKDPSGLWIVKAVASSLDDANAEEMRNGFTQQVYNSRGVHWVDPSGAPEKELALEWRNKADEIESEGLVRFASKLKQLADSYDREADRIKDEHKSEDSKEQ